ncbi:hypothetical protein AMTRI_Chr01g109310 [Amborella trichopoda]
MAVPITEAYTLGFIGAGKMAEAIARGVDKSGILPASRMRTAHRTLARRQAFSSFGVHVYESNIKFLWSAVKEVLSELKPFLSKEKLLVSIAAGIRLNDLQEWTGHGRLIRVMTNTPSLVGMAASVICLGELATTEDEKFVSNLFGAVGKAWTAKEKLLDAVTGLSGSGPAYVYLAIEAMADGGVAAGLPRDLALCLASQTVLGAAAMTIESGKHPGQLKDEVTSPAGTTIAGIHVLEKNGFRGTIMGAVMAASKRSEELSKHVS